MIRVVLAAAVNDEAVLTDNLLASPDVKSGRLKLHCYRGFRSAGLAYNTALDALSEGADWIAFVHQDVYLPEGFLDRLTAQLQLVEDRASNVAIAGLFGADRNNRIAGRVWCSANKRQFTGELPLPARADVLDEYLILVHTRKAIRFDLDLPGFHLFGTDICLTAKANGWETWVLDVPVVHNSRPVVTLDKNYRKAWYYMRRKWSSTLPVHNLICPITRSSWPLWRRYLQIRKQYRFRRERGSMLSDPAGKATELGYQ